MANNVVSDWLYNYAGFADTPEAEVTYHYAAKLDRLVEAAREFCIRAERQLYPSDKPNSDYAKLSDLTAALREIELTSDASSERTQNVC